MKKQISGFLLAAGLVLGLPIVVSAHVTVLPVESAKGAYETYTVKVPVEKESNTTKVVVKLPKNVEFSSYEPATGWETTYRKQASTLTWQAKNGGIKPGEFMRFTFSAKNPDKATSIAWNAYQYYQDGSIVEWTGGEDDETPHAVTKIVSDLTSGTAADSHGKTLSEQEKKSSAKQSVSSGTSWPTWTALAASIAALLISIFAFFRKRK